MAGGGDSWDRRRHPIELLSKPPGRRRDWRLAQHKRFFNNFRTDADLCRVELAVCGAEKAPVARLGAPKGCRMMPAAPRGTSMMKEARGSILQDAVVSRGEVVRRKILA